MFNLTIGGAEDKSEAIFCFSVNSAIYVLFQDLSMSSSSSVRSSTLCTFISDWSSQQVGHWLDKQGLGQYVQLFTAADISGSQLINMDGSKMKV